MGCKGEENTLGRGLQKKKSKSGFLMELDKTDVSTRWLKSKNLGPPTFQNFSFFGKGVAHKGLQ